MECLLKTYGDSIMISALIWYCKNHGVASPEIALKNGEIIKWNCGELPQPSEAEMNQILSDYEDSQDYAISNFSYKTFIGRVYEEFATDIIRLEPRLATVKDLVEYPNFSGLKNYLDACLSAELITADDYSTINSILAEQGIVLES